MSKVVYKYPLSGRSFDTVRMPYKAKVLTAMFQGGTLCLWAEVDGDALANTETFVLVVGTGMEFPDVDMDDYRYVSTVQEGPFVWHVYVEDLDAKSPYKIVRA